MVPSCETKTKTKKGLQLGTGVQLIIKAQKLVTTLAWKIDSSNWADNNTWILLSFIFVVACYHTKIPSALVLFLIGLIFALVLMFATTAGNHLPRPSVIGGHYPDTIIVPTPTQFRNGFLNAGLGQLPLTTLNSVIALCALIDELFPDKHATTSSVAMSVGIMNLVGCWFGAMPLCHGSGGLAGQYRFGARSEVSVIILGSCKLLLGILFGGSLVGLLQLFPTSILAVMLFISGVELACAARSINDNVHDNDQKRENFVIMLLTMGSLVAYSNDGIGFVAGLVSAALLSMQRLGMRKWFKHTLAGFKSVPRVWKDQSLKAENLPIASPSILSTQEERILVSDGSSNNAKSPAYTEQSKSHHPTETGTSSTHTNTNDSITKR
jgi:MFS superfamily sulfate permease-like transporter